MQHEEQELKALLREWQPEPPPFLATRIIANATALPQRSSPAQRLRAWMTQSFDEWNYALAYKGAALAACVMIGLYAGQLSAPPLTTTPIDAESLALGQTLITEDL